MPRTTLDIDAPVLRDLKRLQKRDHKTLGRIVSDLLAGVLREGAAEPRPSPFRWVSKPMGPPRVDLADKDALWAALNERGRRRS
ncbi:MAG: hypothetical protein ACYDCL_23115 [Myxococcales bacterium]